MPRIGVRRSVLAALVTVALLVVPTACSDSSPQSESSPSATAAPPPGGEPSAACAGSSELKASLETLTNVKPLQDGLTALSTAMTGWYRGLVVRDNVDTELSSRLTVRLSQGELL